MAVAVCLTLVSCGGSGGGGGDAVQEELVTELVIETDLGNISVELLENSTPSTTQMIVALALSNSYGGKTFYRVDDGLMAVFGDADDDAALIDPIPFEYSGEPLDRGNVAIGWIGSKDHATNRMIFPLTRLDPGLDAHYAVFGRITEGETLLDQITSGLAVNRLTVRLSQLIFRIITEKGTILIEMDPRITPITINRVSELICEGFYNGLTFHEVNSFFVKGGDPVGDGTGGSGQTIVAEFSEFGRFFRGNVGMWRDEGDIDSADSQFFIMKQQVREFDGSYNMFGTVRAGIEVVDIIQVDDIMWDVSLQFTLPGQECVTGSAPPPPGDGGAPGDGIPGG